MSRVLSVSAGQQFFRITTFCNVKTYVRISSHFKSNITVRFFKKSSKKTMTSLDYGIDTFQGCYINVQLS